MRDVVLGVGGWRRFSAVEFQHAGLPPGAGRGPGRKAAHAGLACGVGERARLVHPQRFARSAPANRGDTALHPTKGCGRRRLPGSCLRAAISTRSPGCCICANGTAFRSMPGAGAGGHRARTRFSMSLARLRRARLIAARRRIEMGTRSSGLAVEAYAVPAKVAALSGKEGQDPKSREEGDAIGLADHRDRRRQDLLLHPRLRGNHRPAEAAARRARAGVFRRDAVARRRDDPPRGRRKDRPANGAYQHERRGRRDRRFRGLGRRRRIFIHINNTNPVLLDDSPERREAEAAGWEIAYDGMEVRL